LFSLALSEPKEKKDSSTGCNHNVLSSAILTVHYLLCGLMLL
jgi:hypothetical protein